MLHSYVTDMAARVTPNTQIPKYIVMQSEIMKQNITEPDLT